MHTLNITRLPLMLLWLQVQQRNVDDFINALLKRLVYCNNMDRRGRRIDNCGAFTGMWLFTDLAICAALIHCLNIIVFEVV